MKKILKNTVVFLALAAIFIPVTALAHQPRIVEGTVINVKDPEVSKAYYGRLPDNRKFIRSARTSNLNYTRASLCRTAPDRKKMFRRKSWI